MQFLSSSEQLTRISQCLFINKSGPELGLGALFASDDVVQLRLLHCVYQAVVLALATKVVMAEAEGHFKTFVTLEQKMSSIKHIFPTHNSPCLYFLVSRDSRTLGCH